MPCPSSFLRSFLQYLCNTDREFSGSLLISYISCRIINIPCLLAQFLPTLHIIEWYADTNLHLAQRSKTVELYFHSAICLHGIVLNWLSTGKTLPFLPLRRGWCLTSSLTNNTHKYSIVNRLLYTGYYSSYILIQILSVPTEYTQYTETRDYSPIHDLLFKFNVAFAVFDETSPIKHAVEMKQVVIVPIRTKSVIFLKRIFSVSNTGAFRNATSTQIVTLATFLLTNRGEIWVQNSLSGTTCSSSYCSPVQMFATFPVILPTEWGELQYFWAAKTARHPVPWFSPYLTFPHLKVGVVNSFSAAHKMPSLLRTARVTRTAKVTAVSKQFNTWTELNWI
jgi:hypothetical protein